MDAPDAWLAIVNPAAGMPRSRGSWDAIERSLRAARVPLEVVHTECEHDGVEIARQAVRDGRRRLIAAGGDGSVNDVVNGVMDAGLADTRKVTLAVAPTGTGNDWARSLGIGREPASVTAAIASGRTMLHDVGIITGPAITGYTEPANGMEPPHRHWYINVAGAGYDAYVTARVPRPVPSAFTYLGIALRGLVSYRSPQFRVDADGTRFDQRMLLVFAANARFCGNRMHVAPDALLDDGMLDVVAIEDLGLLRALPKIVKLYRGRLYGDPVVRHVRCARVRIEADPPAEVQADGQMAGHTPAEFSLVRQALTVIVPPGGPCPPRVGPHTG